MKQGVYKTYYAWQGVALVLGKCMPAYTYFWCRASEIAAVGTTVTACIVFSNCTASKCYAKLVDSKREYFAITFSLKLEISFYNSCLTHLSDFLLYFFSPTQFSIWIVKIIFFIPLFTFFISVLIYALLAEKLLCNKSLSVVI